MEGNNEATPIPIFEQLKEYAETRIKLAKYQAIDTGTSITASIIADVAVLFSVVIAVIFASFTLAFYLADVFGGRYWAGFGCVALLYIIFAIAIKINKQALEKPIINMFLKKFFK